MYWGVHQEAVNFSIIDIEVSMCSKVFKNEGKRKYIYIYKNKTNIILLVCVKYFFPFPPPLLVFFFEILIFKCIISCAMIYDIIYV